MKTEFQIGSDRVVAEWEKQGGGFSLKIFEREIRGEIIRWDPPHFTVRHCGHVLRGAFYRNGDFVDVHLPKGTFRIRLSNARRAARSAHAEGGLSSPMPGKVIKVLVKPGEKVKKGDLLMILEAMKMEHKIQSPKDGTVQKIHFSEGERVAQETDLLEIA